MEAKNYCLNRPGESCKKTLFINRSAWEDNNVS